MFKSALLFVVLAFQCGCANASAYRVEVAPESTSARPDGVPLIYLVPFKDARSTREIYTSRNGSWENVLIEDEARTSALPAWKALKLGDLSYLWHRQLALELANAGFAVKAAGQPLSEADALANAKSEGASYLMSGKISRLKIAKRGHDRLLGTNFTGTDYTFSSQIDLVLKDSSGAVVVSKGLAFTRKFYNPEKMGSSDRETFPHYFMRGLPEAAHAVAADEALRKAVGLPTLTPTPTATATPEISAEQADKAAKTTPVPQPSVTPEPGPYWVCPKDGKRMDPAWEICPYDGTKRKDFILKRK